MKAKEVPYQAFGVFFGEVPALFCSVRYALELTALLLFERSLYFVFGRLTDFTTCKRKGRKRCRYFSVVFLVEQCEKGHYAGAWRHNPIKNVL